MLTRSQQDASFYGAIHSLLANPSSIWGEPVNRVRNPQASPLVQQFLNRRTASRKPFSCPQLIAPYDGRELPSQVKFQQTDCHDISTSGFSFQTERIPDTQFLVIALGTVPFSFFSAEIVHVDRQKDESGPTFKIGCRFLKRLGTLPSERDSVVTEGRSQAT